ncbi:AAA family ATPase [Methanosarcina sp. Mfa9]|uniref:AAA family ATPase n=1 Tax=Methanosarcina sp. Mfa9 TaxID=3439063 RepID=UPI003F860F26
MKKRVTDLIVILSDGLYEREEVVAVSLLSALSGQSIFLYGLPGTAKSLIARRISKVFKDTTHFEYLMQRFSTPEDVFGPVSIRELKQDNYIRKTEGYLPTADFAFLDEIWKSSPAILNTLLTIINERIYRNGGKDEKVPLKALIAASNETPPPNQGLEALYDRFVMRIIVNPVEERENFEKLLEGDAASIDIEIPDGLQFSHDDFEQLPSEIVKVQISREVFTIINSIRVSLDEFNKDNPKVAVYVSDRRWQKIALILKTSAFLCDRTEVIPVDALILRHCLWTLEQNREQINEIIEKCVKEFSCTNNEKLNSWELNHKDLEKGVSDTFFYTENIYDAEKNDKVLNYGGNSGYDNDAFLKWFDSTPPIKIKKGTQKAVDLRTKDTFVKACEDSLSSLMEIIDDTKSHIVTQKKLNETPFVPPEKRELVFDASNSYLKDLENHRLNAEHLLERVQSYAISDS